MWGKKFQYLQQRAELLDDSDLLTFCVFSSILHPFVKVFHLCGWWWTWRLLTDASGCLSPSSAALEGQGDKTFTPDLLNQNPLRRWELMSFSCHVWQALICFHSASHHSFKDEWIIHPRGSKKIGVPPKKWLVSKNCWPEANYFS